MQTASCLSSPRLSPRSRGECRRQHRRRRAPHRRTGHPPSHGCCCLTQHGSASPASAREATGSAGLETADLVVSPIGRFVAGKQPPEDWAVVESKLRRRKGDNLGAGLVILPKE